MENVIAAFNAARPEEADAAFDRIDALLDARREDRAQEQHRENLAQSRANHARATLRHPFTASKRLPLLQRAAELAESNIWYWIDYGRAAVETGALPRAEQAFSKALSLASKGEADPRDKSVCLSDLGDVRRAQGDLPGALAAYEEDLEIARGLSAQDPGNAGWARDVSVSLNKLGDVRVAQGDLPGALAAYEEDLEIARGLSAQDPGNAGWARDVWVSVWKLARIDEANAVAHWSEVVERIEAMKAKGILLPTDERFLEAARQNLAAAKASGN